MDYKKFYLAVRRYAKKRISRGMFLTDWKDAQQEAGIGTRKVGPCGITHEGYLYNNAALFRFIGEKVFVKKQIGCLEVRDCRGKFICLAECQTFSE